MLRRWKLLKCPVILPLSLTLAVTFMPVPAPGDTFTVTNQRETSLPGKVLDIAVSSGGRWDFVLTDQGKVAIYRFNGDLVQTLDVGTGYKTLEFSPAGNRLLLGGADDGKLKILTLALLYDLDYSGLPFKGPADAPVTIAVFEDFQ